MITAYKEYWKGYLDFKGRTGVGGYWWAFLANFIVSFAVSILSSIMNAQRPGSGAAVTYSFMLLCMLPSLAILVRRLRDGGNEWTNIFWAFLPIAGVIILIVKLCKPSQEDTYKPLSQPVGTNGTPAYHSPPKPAYQTNTQPARPSPAPGGSILTQYRAGLSYLDNCGAFDEAKFREFNRIAGSRFSESDIQTQLSNSRMMMGGMEDVRRALRSGMVEAIQAFEELERKGIDLSKYSL